MKFTIAAALVAGAATVSAQISALPPCGIQCGLVAAADTPCNPATDFDCTCQYANQQIIAPILESCLSASCTNTADITAAISAGEAICATISQTATPTAAAATTTTTPSAAPASTTPTPTTATSTVITTTAPATVSQIGDGQPQAPTSAAVSTTTVAPYYGAAGGREGLMQGAQALLLAAGGVAAVVV